MERAVLLHNIRSAHNVGSIFRTADGAGVTKIYISGYTPLPVDRFGRTQKEIAKTALGAERTIPWEYRAEPAKLIRELRHAGMQIIGLEQDERAEDYRAVKLKKDALLVLGNEVRGISKPLRDLCDVLIEIPMHGDKESLNVSVAAGIALYTLFSN
ncbi:MAG TPA: RNA methyltransferase [Candidatus Paceibacterota bacterium]|nr:RNA methyltransferase [Candidatus Paceibacterota bacterium]